MSQAQAAERSLPSVKHERLPDGSLRIYAPPSAIIEVRDTAGNWLASFFPNEGRLEIVGSPAVKPPPSSDPLGDIEKFRKAWQLGADLGAMWLDSRWSPSIRELALELSAQLALDLPQKADGLTLSAASFTDDHPASAKPTSASRP